MANTNVWDDPPNPAFFLQVMGDHNRVTGIASLSANRHDITRDDGKVVKVFLTDTYTFSESDYAHLRAQHPDVTCVVSASSWNHFTPEVRLVARADDVGTFMIRDFMGAFHYSGDAFLDYS
jgi:hypothetical protein